MIITAIHPARNENAEIEATYKSMLSAGADKCIIFDDGSDIPLDIFPDTVNIRNNITIGPSVCRNLGAQIMTSDVLVFADAHTRVNNLKDISNFALNEGVICIPSMRSLYGSSNVAGYSRNFIMKGKSSELFGFDMTNNKPDNRYSYSYGNWGGFFVMSRETFDNIGGWVNHKFWGYNDPSLYVKAFFCNYDCVLDKETIYHHKGKAKTGFGYPVKAIEPLLNIFHSYYVLFDLDTFENYWLPLLEKEHKWMFTKGLEYIDSNEIKKEEKAFKMIKKRGDDEFFNIFLKMPNNRKEFKR